MSDNHVKDCTCIIIFFKIWGNLSFKKTHGGAFAYVCYCYFSLQLRWRQYVYLLYFALLSPFFSSVF